jgi:hypothetical protein
MAIFKQREMRVPVMDMRLLVEEAEELEMAFNEMIEGTKDDTTYNLQVFKNFVANFSKALKEIKSSEVNE